VVKKYIEDQKRVYQFLPTAKAGEFLDTLGEFDEDCAGGVSGE